MSTKDTRQIPLQVYLSLPKVGRQLFYGSEGQPTYGGHNSAPSGIAEVCADVKLDGRDWSAQTQALGLDVSDRMIGPTGRPVITLWERTWRIPKAGAGSAAFDARMIAEVPVDGGNFDLNLCWMRR